MSRAPATKVGTANAWPAEADVAAKGAPREAATRVPARRALPRLETPPDAPPPPAEWRCVPCAAPTSSGVLAAVAALEVPSESTLYNAAGDVQNCVYVIALPEDLATLFPLPSVASQHTPPLR